MNSKELQIKQSKQHWSQMQEAGTLLGMQFLYFLYRIFGRFIFSLVMYPVSLYFLVFRKTQRRASLQFLRMHYRSYPNKWRSLPNCFHVILHFKAFAEVVLDKLLGWLVEINESEFVLTQPNVVQALLDDGRGQLIVGSHFGNLEFCRGFMQRYKNKIINILLYDKHAGNFVKMMQKQSKDSRLNVFQVDEFDITTIVMLKEKVDRGEWVFIAGDRIPLSGLQRTVNVDFYGRPAPLPIGPYMLAKALACPVKYMFAYRDSAQSNRVVFDVLPACERLTLSRNNKMNDIKHYAQLFADKLQEHSAQAPYQWFNFYDFWQPTDHLQQQTDEQRSE